MRTRQKQGSVVFDRRRNTWYYLYCDNGTRRTRTIGPVTEFPTRAEAWAEVAVMKRNITQPTKETRQVNTVRDIATRYEAERMPTRTETRRVYLSFLRGHILPKWGETAVSALAPRDVELWLRGLTLAPKTKVHLRNLLHMLVDFAMWSGVLELARNPLDLVQVKGATRRVRKPRSLTLDEFRKLAAQLQEPVRTLAFVSACIGLRISEARGLRWSDVNWLDSTVSIERAVVQGHVDSTKNDNSRRTLAIAPEVLTVLKAWKQTTQFPEGDSWIFPSIVRIGRKPLCYTSIRCELRRAAVAAGIEPLSTHSFRHSFRTWVDAVGTPAGITKGLMRHASISTTMDTYGTALTDDMRKASEKVAALALKSDCGQLIAFPVSC